MKYSCQSKFYLVCIGTILSLVLNAILPVAQAQEEPCGGKCDQLTINQPQSQPYTPATTRRVYIRNQCSRPIQIALTYLNPSGNWVTDGWWSFRPNEISFLISQGKAIRSNNRIIYLFAECTDGSGLWWSGDQQIRFGNRMLPMRTIEMGIDSNGDFQLPLTCN